MLILSSKVMLAGACRVLKGDYIYSAGEYIPVVSWSL